MRALLSICAGGWLLLLAGCATTDVAGLLVLQSSGDDESVVVGSLDAVAKSTQEKLQRLEMSAVVTSKGDAYEIESAVPGLTGSRFKLVLTRERSGESEKTRMKLVWIDQGNDDFAAQFMARLVVQSN